MNKKIRFPIHSFINELHAEQGLRRQDYVSYRRYCTRRIRRLRRQLHMTCLNENKKNKTKFDYYKVSVSDVEKDPRSLEIVVLEVERCWASGNQLKQEYHDLREENSRTKVHYNNRFGKAVRISYDLKILLDHFGDDLSKIESEAYHKYMTGVWYMEKGSYGEKKIWVKCKENFSYCYQIYSTLSRDVKGVGLKEIFRELVKIVRDYLKLCEYWISMSDEEVEGGEFDSDVLAVKLSRVLEGRKKGHSESDNTIVFLHREIVIDSDKLIEYHRTGKTLKSEISKTDNLETKLSLYDRLLTSYRDCLVTIRDGIRKHEKAKNMSSINNLKVFHTYIEYISLNDTVNRNETLIELYCSLLGKTDKEGKVKKRVKVEDIIRLYEIILQNIADMKELGSIKDNEDMLKKLDSKIGMYKVYKAFFLASAYEKRNRFKESYSLLNRTVMLFKEYLEMENGDENDKLTIETFIKENIDKQKISVRASNYLFDKATDDKETINIKLRKTGKISILEDLNTYKETSKRNPFLIHYPPAFQHIPCKPLFFDIAGSNLEFPDLKKKLKKKKRFGLF